MDVEYAGCELVLIDVALVALIGPLCRTSKQKNVWYGFCNMNQHESGLVLHTCSQDLWIIVPGVFM